MNWFVAELKYESPSFEPTQSFPRESVNKVFIRIKGTGDEFNMVVW